MVEEVGDGTFASTIGGKRYVFAHYDADKAARTLAELFGVIGEGMHLQGLAESADGSESAVFYGMAAKALFSGVGKDVDRSIRLLKRLCCDNISCDGNPIDQKTFSTHYRGDLRAMMGVAKAALEVQFRDFFEPLLSLVGLRKKAEDTNQSSTTN